MTPEQLRRRIYKLREHQPLTIRLERSLATADLIRRPPWYCSQKEHWLGWLREYDGPGYYGRREWGRSAEFVYNHVVCPPMVLWLGEAAGVPSNVIAAAGSAALSAGPSQASRSAGIRRVIPWAMIELCL
jgi:hypothetical protein